MSEIDTEERIETPDRDTTICSGRVTDTLSHNPAAPLSRLL